MRVLKVFSFLIFSSLANPASASIKGHNNQVPLSHMTCNHPPYKVHLFSASPLVIYISNFLTPEESLHLQEISKDTFTHSAVTDPTGAQGHRQTRTSQSTSISRDATTRCIEARALLFQGFDTPASHLEPLQLVQYTRGEHYHFHTDWFPPSSSSSQTTASHGGNRLSSFFVYVAATNVTGGGTNFPVLDAPRDERWCEFVDCDEPWEAGVTFRPVVGNALFWRNLGPEEAGRREGEQATLHAGLPVTAGVKVGMNIWTREGPLGEEFRGVEGDGGE